MKKLIYDVRDRPDLISFIILSLQHLLAMFSANVIVAQIMGISASMALFTSGLGTLIYIILTRAKVPIYLGTSAAFTTTYLTLLGGTYGFEAAQTGLLLVSVIYILVAGLIKVIGNNWIEKLLPPVVIGPMIMLIGLGLANIAVTNSGLVEGGSIKAVIVAFVSLLTTIILLIKGKGFTKTIPFLIGAFVGTITSFFLGLLSFETVMSAAWVAAPDFKIMFINYQPYFNGAIWAFVPVTFIAISEHIGDHTILGVMANKNFLQEPGLEKTLAGDGAASLISVLLGGAANTSYGENTAVVGMTRVASVWVTGGAAVFAIILSFFGKFTALVNSIPAPVLGGITLLLYGVIAGNGLKILIDSKTDLEKEKNIIIVSLMLIIGLGNTFLPVIEYSAGMALAASVGIVLNLLLKD